MEREGKGYFSQQEMSALSQVKSTWRPDGAHDGFSERMGKAQTLAMVIVNDITLTREQLLQENRRYGNTRLGYNLDMDTVTYQALFQYQSTDSLGSLVHRKALEALNSYTRFQLETHLGERFNVLSSTYPLQIKEGEMWSDRMNEPFKNMLIRGQKYREHHGSLEVEREKAEVEGFITVTEPLLTDPRVPVGTIVLSISPQGKPGSIYQHNFYDMYILREDNNGRYIEARRYSSALQPKEYVSKIAALNPLYQIPAEVDDVFFLSHPIRVMSDQYQTPEAIHAFFHKEHTYMSEKQFSFIKHGVLPYIDAYTQILSQNPYDKQMQTLAYRAVLNRADELWGMLSGKLGGYVVYDAEALIAPTMVDIQLRGSQHVRQVLTGCGISGDEAKEDRFEDPVEKMLESLFGSLFKVPDSVFDFGLEDSEWFTCPDCRYKATGPIGNTCPGCQLTKEAYAKKSGEVVCD